MNYKEVEKRIDELNLDGYKQIKKNDWDIPKKLMDWLEEHDFKKVGEGLFSSVFHSEKEKFIVKVNDGIIDEGYLSFVEFCQANKGNPHLPKMGKIKKYDDWYIIFIEKLEPITDNDIGLKDDTCWEFFNSIIKIFDNENKNARYEKRIKNIYDRYSNGKELTKELLKEFYDIAVLMHEFKKIVNRDNLDLHSGNIMKRGNTLVVIDPST